MNILFPAPRPRRPVHPWIVAAALCIPPLVAWVVIVLEISGLWWTVRGTLESVPLVVQACVMLVSPLGAALIGVVSVLRLLRAGVAVDRRLVAFTVAGLVLAAASASAAWFRAS